MAMQSPTTIPSAEAARKGHGGFLFDNWFGKWVLQRLTGFCVWLWFFIRFFDLRVPFAPSLSREWLLLPAACNLILIVLFRRWVRLLAYPFYVLFFPLTAIVLISRPLFSILTLPVQAGRFMSSARALILVTVICIGGWVLAVSPGYPATQAIAALVAHSATFLLFMSVFRWASNPYKPFIAPLEFFSSKGASFFEKNIVRPTLETGAQRDTYVTWCKWILKFIDWIYPSDAPLEKGVTGFAFGSIVTVGVSVFIVVYVVLALSFAFTMLRVESAWGPQLSGIGASRTLFDYLYVTLLSEATAVPSGVVPLTLMGQILVIWNVLSGVLLLTLLIALFTTSVGMRADKAVSTISGHLDTERERYSGWLKTLQSAPKSPAVVIEGKATKIGEP